MISSEDTIFGKIQACLLMSCILLLLYWLWSRRHFYKFALKQPGFWGYPLVGCINKVSSPQDFIHGMSKIYKGLKSHYAFLWLGLQPVFVISDPDLTGKVLTSPNCLNTSTLMYECIRYTLSDGLATMSGEKWKSHRRLLNPSFRQQILQTFFGVFNQELKTTISDYRKLAETKSEFGALQIMKQCSLNAVLKTTMGHNIENYDKVYNLTLQVLDKLVGTAMNSVTLNAMNLSWLVHFDLGYQKMIRNIHSYTKNAIKTRLEANNNNEVNSKINDFEDDVIYIKKPPRIFSDEAAELIESNKLTIEEIEGHIHHIVAAGFLTVSYAVFDALLFLAMHPEKQERLFDEILEIAPEKNTDVSFNALKSSSYLDMVIDETLRLMPSIPIIGRHVCADTKLSDNITVPKGTHVVIDIFHLHRNKNVWGEDAEEFKPERFEPQMIKGLHLYGYIPFSKSSRDCIAKQYALYFVKIMLIGLVRNFKFSTKTKPKDLKLFTTIHLEFKVLPDLSIEER